MISGLILQMFTILSGFILPKIILTCFGSEVNGLVSSLNQFLSYISLVEGGITGVVMANLYKPIVEKDEQKISAVMVTANRFFKKIGILFVAYSVGLSIVYPLLFKTEFNFAYVCSLTLILSITAGTASHYERKYADDYARIYPFAESAADHTRTSYGGVL